MNNSTSTNVQEAEAAAVARVVEKSIRPRILKVEQGDLSAEVLILPSLHGMTAQSMKKYIDEVRTRPERREGTARLVELLSFIEHVNRFKDTDSALFASPDDTAPTLTAVLDYHRAGDGDPRFGKHRALYTFPVSDEWKAWTESSGVAMAQGAFAEFLEERITDVSDPDEAFSSAKKFAAALEIPSFASPSKLLALSRGLSVHVEEKATNRVNPATGETTMFFESSHQDEQGAPLQVPRAFLIQIPVFRGGNGYQFAVRLKYRVAGGRVTWSCEVHQADRAFDDAFREACEIAREKTELPLFYGSPES